jgi:hypothetical protein
MNDNCDGFFNLLAEGLTAEQRSEFFQSLHQANILGHDAELAKLLRALQLYKGYYDSIPIAVQAAADRIERIRQEVFALSDRTGQNAQAVSNLAEQLILDAAKFHQALTGVHTSVEKVIQESAGNLASQTGDRVRVWIEDTMLPGLRDRLLQVASATAALNDAAARSKDAASTVKQEARLARRIHVGAYALAAFIVAAALTLGSWLRIHHWYSRQIELDRVALAKGMEKHREILLKLTRSNHTLELVQDQKRRGKCFLVMENATGWQSSFRQGVIEFSE